MKLLIQPGDGVRPLLKGIKKAKKTVEIVIFRFDQTEVEKALVEAVGRGVFVHALIAFTNRGGEKRLRDLETEFLAKGITVARTARDLVRYHGKMMLVDRKELHLLAFNFTHLDIEHSRSFGIVTRNPKLVQEASRLFEADTKRQEFTSKYPKLVVSPVNARKMLEDFIRDARRELLIYDPKLTDKHVLKLLRGRTDAGVKVRVISESPVAGLPTRKLTMRLHTRNIIRDRRDVFMGSQSLRALELDSRREIGVMFRDEEIVSELRKTFEKDWSGAERVKLKDKPIRLPVGKAAKKVANVVSEKIPLEPIAQNVRRAMKKNGSKKLGPKDVEKTMRAAVKKSVKHVVEKVAREAVVDVLEQVS